MVFHSQIDKVQYCEILGPYCSIIIFYHAMNDKNCWRRTHSCRSSVFYDASVSIPYLTSTACDRALIGELSFASDGSFRISFRNIDEYCIITVQQCNPPKKESVNNLIYMSNKIKASHPSPVIFAAKLLKVEVHTSVSN